MSGLAAVIDQGADGDEDDQGDDDGTQLAQGGQHAVQSGGHRDHDEDGQDDGAQP